MGTRGFVGYKHNGKIHGWYNHSDSYPSYLGKEIIEKTLNLSQDQIKDFFLNRITFVDNDDTKFREEYQNHKSVWEIDWTTDSTRLQDGGEFYKDGLFCEYSYIFDLDTKNKSLLLFKGFGKKPAKGYEDWFEESSDTKYYAVPCGTLKYKSSVEDTYAWMIAHIESKSSEEKERTAARTLKKILTTKREDLPTLMGEVSNLQAEYGQAKDLAVEILEKSLKTPHC